MKPCKPNQFRHPETNRCRNKKTSAKKTVVQRKHVVNVLPQVPPATRQTTSNKLELVRDVDALLGLFEMEIITLIGLSRTKKSVLLNKFMDSSDVVQLEEVCQGQIKQRYIEYTVKHNVDYILLLKVKGLVVSYALLKERMSSTGVKYMYIDILCARKFSSTGRHMLLAAEEFSLRKGVKFTNLSSLPEVTGFYSKMGYKSITINNI